MSNVDGDMNVEHGCSHMTDGMIIQRIQNLPLLPWTEILLQIPLSDSTFIFGSAATWLAEMCLLDADPIWVPNDIDVFVCLSHFAYDSLVEAFIRQFKDSLVSIKSRPNRAQIFDVTLPGMCTVSFIRCPACASSKDVVNQFDVDVCTPIVSKSNEYLLFNWHLMLLPASRIG